MFYFYVSPCGMFYDIVVSDTYTFLSFEIFGIVVHVLLGQAADVLIYF